VADPCGVLDSRKKLINSFQQSSSKRTDSEMGLSLQSFGDSSRSCEDAVLDLKGDVPLWFSIQSETFGLSGNRIGLPFLVVGDGAFSPEEWSVRQHSGSYHKCCPARSIECQTRS